MSELYAKDNPFYCQPIFSHQDIERSIIRWPHTLWLWLLPTSVTIAEGYAFFWKRWQDRIYLVRVEIVKDKVVARYT